MAGEADVSEVLQELIDKGLFKRLPATFATYFLEQIQGWKLLFPAERTYQERLFKLIDSSDPQAVASLFAPLREIERQMGIDEKTWQRDRFTVDQLEFLQRSPQYQQWRQAVAGVFAKLDPLLDAEIVKHGRPRLVVVTSPAELPAGPERTWLRLRDHGKRIALDVPESPDYLGQLLAGGAGVSIAQQYARETYDSWEISASKALPRGERAVRLNYQELNGYRLRLMEEVRHIVESGEARTPQQLSERLKTLRLLASEGDFAKDEILSEFVRAVFLNGNGTLLINNTFVEWAAIQAARRARPSVMVISFGVRNKLKPFSSLLIHADQETANPIPTQMDTLGTSVDLEVFYQYLWQEFEKYAEYRKNTAYLFVGDGMDELFCIAPADFPLLSAKTPVKPATVFAAMKDWLVLPK
jgi:hypothetical protein